MEVELFVALASLYTCMTYLCILHDILHDIFVPACMTCWNMHFMFQLQKQGTEYVNFLKRNLFYKKEKSIISSGGVTMYDSEFYGF